MYAYIYLYIYMYIVGSPMVKFEQPADQRFQALFSLI